MKKDNRSVNERLDAIEDKLTFKKAKEVMFKDVLLENTGLSPEEYFKNGKATYYNYFSKFAYLGYGLLTGLFAVFLIVAICLNVFVYKQETNLLSLAVLFLPGIQGLVVIATMLFKSIHKPVKNNKKQLNNLIFKENGGCFVKFKNNHAILIINAIFFVGYIVSLCMLTVFDVTMPDHILFHIFFSLLVSLYLCFMVYISLSIHNYETYVFSYEKEDSISTYSNYGGWHYIKK